MALKLKKKKNDTDKCPTSSSPFKMFLMWRSNVKWHVQFRSLSVKYLCYLPEVILQFAGYEGKDKRQQSQQDVIRKDATDKHHRAFVTLKNDLYILG